MQAGGAPASVLTLREDRLRGSGDGVVTDTRGEREERERETQDRRPVTAGTPHPAIAGRLRGHGPGMASILPVRATR